MTEQDFLDIAAYFAANGIKIPDLPAAGALTGSELLEAVQGSSSVKLTAAQIAALVTIPSGVQSVTGGAVDNTDPANPVVNVESGTWTPTVSDISGAATVDILGVSTYQKIGNLITDTCRITVQFDVGQISETFNLDLAIPPNANFINARQVSCIYSIESSIPEIDSVSIQSLAASKLTAIPITMNATGLELIFVCQRTYQYTV